MWSWNHDAPRNVSNVSTSVHMPARVKTHKISLACLVAYLSLQKGPRVTRFQHLRVNPCTAVLLKGKCGREAIGCSEFIVWNINIMK